MRWPWEKKRESKKPVSALRAVVTDKWLSEYRGKVASGAGTTYALFTIKISYQARKALLDEGFRGVGTGKFPTHVIYCTHQVWIDQGRTRLLFNILLNLDVFVAPAQDKAALEITQILKKRLEQCPSVEFVIRKQTRREFPWRQEEGTLDQYWLMNADNAYFSVREKFGALGLTVDEATEIQP